MIQIKDLEDRHQIKELSILHIKAFPDFFLSKLGLPFLNTLYEGYLDDRNSGIIVAEEGGKIIGFIAYSNDYSRFFKELIKHKIFRFAWCSFIAVLKNPAFIKRLLGAFKKSSSVIKNEKYVELASICTEPGKTRKGIGTALIDYLKSIVDFSIYSYINLETDADENELANQFYIKNGFVLYRVYTTVEGRRMNEYRFKPGVYR